MENKSANFWNNRIHNFGHTGWADFNIYAFDQPARLKAIKQLITKHRIKGALAFDFGCGTGDFSNLLSGFFNTVKGFDITEKAVEQATEKYRENKNMQFFTGCTLQQLPLPDNSVDFILSITVLDHIKNDNELDDILSFFNRKLTPSGNVMVLEYALPGAVKGKSEYQRFDLYSTWKNRFLKCGFKIVNEYGFYHPQDAPSVSYQKYMDDTERKWWHALKRFGFARKRIASIAKKIVSSHDDFFYESSSKDVLKIMTLAKTERFA